MIDEKLLVEQARSGSKAAFRELVEHNKKGVYYLALDMLANIEDAEDVSQEVFIKAFNSLNKFKGDSKFSTWLYRITVNTCLTLRNKKSHTAFKANEEMEEIIKNENRLKDESHTADPEKSVNMKMFSESLKSAVEKLSPKEKTVFILRNYKELSFEEIVKIVKLKSGTVRSLNFRALQKLRTELSYYIDEPLKRGNNG